MSNGRLAALCVAIVVSMATAVLGPSVEAAAGRTPTASARLSADFNGDGVSDLAVGNPHDLPHAAGSVNVIYGSGTGLTAAHNQLWTQDSPGIKDTAEPFDFFGYSVAAGNFNGDAFADLAIGVPGENLESFDAAGAVQVLYGSHSGLSASGNQFWTQDSPGIAGTAKEDDFLGISLGAANFGGGPADDLAIGVQGEDVGSANGAGGVNVLYGSAAGLHAAGNQLWTQASPGIPDDPKPGDEFGFSLSAANFGKSSISDLAVGVPFDEVGSKTNAGSIEVLYGTTNGLKSTGSQRWTLDTSGIQGTATLADLFGRALAAGRFNQGSQSDLAIGIPNKAVSGKAMAGAVQVLYGSTTGLSAAGNQEWTQVSTGIDGDPGRNDQFGWALAAGNLGLGLNDDLAIGIPGETVASEQEAGAVEVIYGTPAGLNAANSQSWSQGSDGILDDPGSSDHFGWAVSVRDFGNGVSGDLAVGVKDEPVPRLWGAVNVIYGTGHGLDATNNQFWTQNSPGIRGTAVAEDEFGYSFA